MRSNGARRLRGCSCRGDQAEPSEKVPQKRNQPFILGKTSVKK